MADGDPGISGLPALKPVVLAHAQDYVNVRIQSLDMEGINVRHQFQVTGRLALATNQIAQVRYLS